jgi:hypothetical protein
MSLQQRRCRVEGCCRFLSKNRNLRGSCWHDRNKTKKGCPVCLQLSAFTVRLWFSIGGPNNTTREVSPAAFGTGVAAQTRARSVSYVYWSLTGATCSQERGSFWNSREERAVINSGRHPSGTIAEFFPFLFFSPRLTTCAHGIHVSLFSFHFSFWREFG